MWGGGIIGTGVVLLKFATPSPEKLLAEMSPEVRADAEKNMALREAEQRELIRIVKQTSSSNEPVWKTGSIQSPWDPDYKRTTESLLVTKERFEKEQAAKQQKEEIDRMKEQSRLTEELEKTQKKGWFH